MKSPKFVKRLKEKWKITSNWDFIMIMIVFSLAGMTIGYERRPIFHLIGITKETPLLVKTLIYIPLIVPIYQLNLIIYGTILGQFKFFWEKEKQLVRFLKKAFVR